MTSNHSRDEQLPPENIPLQDLPPPPPDEQLQPSGLSPGRVRRSFHRTRSLFHNRGTSPGSEDPHARRSRGHSPFSNRRYDPVPDVPELHLGDPFVPATTYGGDGESSKKRPQVTETVSFGSQSGMTENVFDNEGGMDVNMDTMREGLIEVLENEVSAGSWLPGHSRIGSQRHASPNRRGSRRQSRPSIHGRADSNAITISSEDDGDFSRPQSTATEGLDPGFYRYSIPTSMDDSDTIGLTDPAHLQPMSGASHQRASSGSVSPRGRLRSSSSGKRPGISVSSRLGDDLNNVELGLNRLTTTHSQSPTPHARKKSLIPGNPNSLMARRLSVAVQNISQRVVNLSNDPNTELTRKPSIKSNKSGHESPPVVVETGEEGSKAPTAFEKPIFPIIERRQVEHPWHLTSNPLRGKSLKIFSPTNRLRIALCDILVHPFV